MTASKWVVALTVAFGAFMAVMDVSVVNVALPHMMGSFSTSLSSITWIATSYSIAEIVLASMAGWLAILIGRKRLYLLSFALFTAGSALCGIAHSFEEMLLFRVIQGIGGGALIPVSQAILRETFPPEEQGMAMAVYGMAVVLAPALGPILGGWLTDQVGWPWIFYINLPICAIGMLLTSAVVHDPPYLKRGVKTVDWGGIALLAICLTMMQVVLERGQAENWFESRLIIAGTTICVLSMGALIWCELVVPEPIIDLRLLKNVPLATGSLLGGIFGLGLFGTTFIVPQYAQELMGYSALEAGMLLSPRALTLLVCMPIVGTLYKYVDARVLITFGIGVLASALWQLSHLSLYADYRSLVPMLATMGIGMPFMFVTLSTVSLSSVARKDMTHASSLFTLTRSIGGNIGYAFAATILARGVQTHRAVLVTHLTPYDYGAVNTHAAMTHALVTQGLSTAAADQGSLALMSSMVNRQATMLAYNDAAFWFMIMFLLTLPGIFLLPRRKKNGSPPAEVPLAEASA